MLGIEKMFIAKADLGPLADSHRSLQSPAVRRIKAPMEQRPYKKELYERRDKLSPPPLSPFLHSSFVSFSAAFKTSFSIGLDEHQKHFRRLIG
jgi:hypothetical protein